MGKYLCLGEGGLTDGGGNGCSSQASTGGENVLELHCEELAVL